MVCLQSGFFRYIICAGSSLREYYNTPFQIALICGLVGIGYEIDYVMRIIRVVSSSILIGLSVHVELPLNQKKRTVRSVRIPRSACPIHLEKALSYDSQGT